MNSFQKDLRKTLTQYALAPIFVIALVGSLLFAWGWQHDVRLRSEEVRHVAVEVVDKLLTDYTTRIEYVAQNEDFTNIRQDAQHRRALYEWLYHEVNIRHDSTQFYLVGTDGEMILGSQVRLPEYLQDMPMTWGIWQRMKAAPQETILEFSTRLDQENSDLLLGRAVVRDGEIRGYWLFVLSGEYIANTIHSSYLDFALIDRFGYAAIVTNPALQDRHFNALPKALKGKNHQVARLDNNDFYVTSEPLGDRDFLLYTAMPVGELEARYENGAVILLVVLLLLVPIVLYHVRRDSQAKSRAVDELLEGIEALKKGDMTARLELSGSDFATVAEAYNHMVESLKSLMAQNEARAKANAVSEVRQLEAQFHPHFIFNTLENIKFMIKLNPEAAMRMIVNLSAILRYGINNLEQEVRLSEEWQYTTSYLEIMQYRFGKRLKCHFNLEVKMDEVRLPKLIFQPILENAIKYGESDDGSILIEMSVYEKQDMLRIKIVNRGKPISAEKLAEIRALLQSDDNQTIHTGIFNVHRRLRLMYGERHGLSIDCPPEGGTVVELSLPLMRADEASV